MTFIERPAAPSAAKIKIHGPQAYAGMRRAGRLAAEALDMITEYVQPGVTTERLDEIAFDYILARNAVPATLN